MQNTFQFTIPHGVSGGQRIRIATPDGRNVDVNLPANARPGQKMQINLDNLPQQANQNTHNRPNTQLMKIIVPQGCYGGQLIQINTPEGRRLNVTLPPSASPGKELIFDSGKNTFVAHQARPQAPGLQIEVLIPKGVGSGQLLAVRAPNGQQVNVAVPQSASSGDKLVVDMSTGKIVQHIPTGIQDAIPIQDNNFQHNALSPSQLTQQFPSWFGFQAYQSSPIPIGTRNARTNLPPPHSSGRKKALLVGINYPGTRAELKGCINDVVMMREFLMRHGFQNTPTNMVCLVDNTRDPNFLPTKANILKGIQWLVAGAGAGDTLFFHYSGHGAQEPDQTGRESDGMNETLVPMDFQTRGTGMISDDQMWDMMCGKLPNGCRLYSIMDCCHSGTGLDLCYQFNSTGWSTSINPNFTEADIIMFSGCRDNQTSADAWSHDMNASGGAMTTSFVSAYNRRPGASIATFLSDVQSDIRRRGFTQIPQLSSSQTWDPNRRHLDFSNGIVPNQNSLYGKVKTQHYKPQTPDMGSSPLGPLLLGAGLLVFVAPDILEGVGDVGELIGAAADIGGGGFIESALGLFDGF